MAFEEEEESVEYLNSLIELAKAYVGIGFERSALPHLKLALEIIMRILKRLETRRRKGETRRMRMQLSSRGNSDDAMIDDGTLKKDSPDGEKEEALGMVLVKLLLNLARLHLELKMLQTALACLKEAHAKDGQLYPDGDSPYSFDILVMFAQWYAKQNIPGRALQCLQKALTLPKRSREQMGKYYSEKSRLCILQGDFEMAAENLKKSLEVFEEMAMDNKDGQMNSTSTTKRIRPKDEKRYFAAIGELQVKLASLHFNERKFELSARYFAASLKTYESLLGKVHPRTIDVLEKLAFVYMEHAMTIMAAEKQPVSVSVSRSIERPKMLTKLLSLAEKQYVDLVKRQIYLFGESDAVVTSLIFLGDCLFADYLYDKAYLTYEKAFFMVQDLSLAPSKVKLLYHKIEQTLGELDRSGRQRKQTLRISRRIDV